MHDHDDAACLAIWHRIKAASADGEEAWRGVGEAPGLRCWRIEKFKVVAWPERQYGTFYDGDSYVVLHTYARGDALAWDVFFWIGKKSSQDEYGTARLQHDSAEHVCAMLPPALHTA